MLSKQIIPSLIAALCLVQNTYASERIAADLALIGATIVDVPAGSLVRGKTVLLKGDTIVAVVDDKALAAYAPKKSLRLPGKFLMPGLWDTHVHFGGGPELIEENKRLLPLYLAHGITTVRDCSGDLADTVLDWRARINAG